MGAAIELSARVRGSVRGSAARADAVAAALLLAGGLAAIDAMSTQGSVPAAVAACTAGAAAVAVRRRVPLLAALTATVALVSYERVTHDHNGAFAPVAVVLTFYLLGRSRTTKHDRVGVALALLAALAASLFVSAELGRLSLASAGSSWVVMAVAPLAAGWWLARHSLLGQQLAAAAARLRDEQALSTARAAADERNRVARDLHDVVAHSVSVMAVQAGAARLVADQRPDESDRALAVVGTCGRDALVDLRRIVGVLRRDADPGFGCGAGLVDLPRLVERVRLAGITVHLNPTTGNRALTPALDLVAYRIVQEALTNVVKHAGPGASADVRVTVNEANMTIDVTNTSAGSVATANANDTAGHGLVGMRERVREAGGELHAGPRHGSGFAVHASIPLRAGDRDSATSRGDSPPRQPWPSVRRVRWLIGPAFVVACVVAMEVEAATSTARRGPWALNAAIVAIMGFAAIAWRRAPLLLLAVVGGLAVVLSGGLTSFDRSTVTGLYSLALPLFAVAVWEPRKRAVAGLVFWTVVATADALVRRAAVGGLAGALVMGMIVWTAGRVWRAQRTLVRNLAETNGQLAAERDAGAQLAVATERTRIARELHGLVADGVVSMIVQAESARRLLANHAAEAIDAIAAVEISGRETLNQLRRILGVLRSSDLPRTREAMPVPLLPTLLPQPVGPVITRELMT